MGAVDEGNKLKRGNTCEMICRRGGHQSLFTWLLNTVLINSYLLNFHSSVLKKEKLTDQTEFRTKIIKECFTISLKANIKRKRVNTIAILPKRDIEAPHSLTRRAYKQDYVVCKKEGIPRKKRRILGEISTNKKVEGCRKFTIFRCNICNAPIYKDGTCWSRFHSIEWSNQ